MTHTAQETRGGWPRFALHYLEMVVAMFAGMVVLGFLESAAGLGISHAEHPDLGYLIMATNMSAGMAAWMLFRGHGRRSTLEMCVAMYVPAVPLFPLLWLGAIGGMTLMVLAHVAMFPLMLGAMLLRRSEYLHCAA
ncbi:hypothetical protein [Actinocorallia longicatena]|uniref:Flagellar biosynthetic protein FliP n=1 Tax=Actinocorallia longicatena TaxID=111803 RepID=A0ABP6PYN9_9ACTN